jgi:hypothetical protein
MIDQCKREQNSRYPMHKQLIPSTVAQREIFKKVLRKSL